MSIKSGPTINFTGEVGVYPRRGKLVTTDSLATVTTAGYLKQDSVTGGFLNSDILDVIYNYNTSTGAGIYNVMTVSVSNGVVTLAQAADTGGVLLPTVVNTAIVATNTTGTLATSSGTLLNPGSYQAGSSGVTGGFLSYPPTASKGSFKFQSIDNAGNFANVLSNASTAQATTWTLPDPGAATANVLLDTGTGASATITTISTGATPVPLVDPGSCTITAAAGALNTANVTIQVKDGAGNNIARSVFFTVYASSASNGLTLASPASTGFSVSSGGLSLANGTAVTTQIRGMTSATGGCVLALLDTAKQTSYLVLVLNEGVKISAQLTAGSYG